jgi:hypothetical protein
LEAIFRPSVSDNMEQWKVLDGDAQILIFLESSKELSESHVIFLVDSIDIDIINMLNNTLPKGFKGMHSLGENV